MIRSAFPNYVTLFRALSFILRSHRFNPAPISAMANFRHDLTLLLRKLLSSLLFSFMIHHLGEQIVDLNPSLFHVLDAVELECIKL